MSANAIRAGRAFVELFADDSKLTRGLQAAQAKLKAFGAGVTSIGRQLFAVGAAAAAPLAAAALSFSTYGDALHKMAARTGAGVDALSELDFAAGQSGTSLEAVEKSMQKLNRTVEEARQGSKSARAALGELGLSWEALAGVAPDQQLERVADTLTAIYDPGRRAALAMDVFGRSGLELLPLLQEGSAGIRRLREQARALALTINPELANAAADFNDALGELWAQVKALVFHLGAGAAGSVKDWIRSTQESLAGTIKWVQANGQLVASASAVAVGVAAAGVALIGVGYALTAAAEGFNTLVTVATTVASIVKVLFTPLGIASAIVGALTVAFVRAAAATHSWSLTLGLAADAWAALRAALSDGDLQRAGEIAFGGLKLLWSEMVAAMRLKWSEVHQAVSETVSAAVDLATGGRGNRVAQAIAQHQADRSEIRRTLAAERQQYADLLAQRAAQTTETPAPVPTPVQAIEVEPASRERQRFEGTLSALSERMFHQGQDGTFKRLDTIASNTRATVDAIRGLARHGMVYTR